MMGGMGHLCRQDGRHGQQCKTDSSMLEARPKPTVQGVASSLFNSHSYSIRIQLLLIFNSLLARMRMRLQAWPACCCSCRPRRCPQPPPWDRRSLPISGAGPPPSGNGRSQGRNCVCTASSPALPAASFAAARAAVTAAVGGCNAVPVLSWPAGEFIAEFIACLY